MKTILAALVFVMLPTAANAGWLFGPNSRTTVNYYGVPPTSTVYYSEPATTYYSAPVVTYSEVPVVSGNVVRGRYRTRTHVHRSGRVHHRTHTREVVE